jgi:hypothetical protein
LQEAAVLELQHPPASAGPGAPTAACWQLLPAGANLVLTEADVDAAAAEAAALVGLAGLGGEQRRPEEEGHDAEEPGDSDAATAEQPAGSSGGQVGAAAAGRLAQQPRPNLTPQHWLLLALLPMRPHLQRWKQR